ncbi:MAG: tryptophanase [Candidatus Schekmanbacteria bacterium]|nr:tryptophanase [Candidatus Schekmanbacteria bacterium]
MNAEPYKLKEVKKIRSMKPYERWNLLKNVDFNTFHVCSDQVTFDLVSRGMSAWSHFQKAGYMAGDEAYAGSRNFCNLVEKARLVFGIDDIVPAHNGLGAEKLLTTTMLRPGQVVVQNRGTSGGLVAACGGRIAELTGAAAPGRTPVSRFGADLDLARLREVLDREGENVAYLHLETCPAEWNGQPISLTNIRAVRAIAVERGLPLVIDISNVMVNAYWIRRAEGHSGDLVAIAREIISNADIVLMDASQDCRSDVGGFIASAQEALFEKFRNQVVVFEGLHTYGGMTGRAMEVFSVGLGELHEESYTEWYCEQVSYLADRLAEREVPVYRGGRGVGLDVEAFLPHLDARHHPKFVLAASLYIQGGIRGRIEGTWAHNTADPARGVYLLELPRCAFSRNHLDEIGRRIGDLYRGRKEITGLRLLNEPEFVDEAKFEPWQHRLFVSLAAGGQAERRGFEPYKVAIFEPVRLTGRDQRRRAMEAAGYNTFLLDSEDVYIDFLTDSGTSAMSCYQWEGMTNSSDAPYSNRHYLRMVEEFRDILGYSYVIPTHQGRAAEHIMSQVMIKPGQIVPGNMYFTTTKLHQEMAGGVFRDVIVDEAYDPTSRFPWKGNIDLAKLEREIAAAGPENVAYISFEMSVNMAGGQPFCMDNVRSLARLCERHNISIMFDATRCVENAYMIKRNDPKYSHQTVREILREMLSYGDGCTVSAKKDFLVNMGGILACNSAELNRSFLRMLRVWEGDVTNGGLDPKDIEALHRGLLDSLDDDYIQMRIEQTQRLGTMLLGAGVPIVEPPGTHAIFIDARRFLPQVDQDEYPAQALSAAIYIETGVRTMERGNVSKGRDPVTGNNYRPPLELVRLTIPRRVYTSSHIDYVAEGIVRVYEKRDKLSGLRFTYEPKVLRFFQGRFAPLAAWPS